MKHIKQLVFVIALMTISASAFQLSAQYGDLPPDAVPGKCYSKCMIPAEYQTVTEEILVKEASTHLQIVPATYETVTEEVLVKEAYTVYEVLPPKFTSVTEEILVKEAGYRLECVDAAGNSLGSANSRGVCPSVYETVTEEMLVAAASTKWVRGKADPNCVSQNPNDCMVWCLKEVPAQYKSIRKQVLRSSAATREIAIPAEYKTIKRTVLDIGAMQAQVNNATGGGNSTVMEIAPGVYGYSKSYPAEYKTVTKKVVSSPASTTQVTIPAEYKTVTSRQMISSGGVTEFREVLCESDLTSSTISKIQRALLAAGFSPGPVDNVLGEQTKQAIIEYQKANGLPVGVQGNNIPLETLKALGVM